VRLTTLGRDCALLELDGRVVRLRPRHSEILVLLALTAQGLVAAGDPEGFSLGPGGGLRFVVREGGSLDRSGGTREGPGNTQEKGGKQA